MSASAMSSLALKPSPPPLLQRSKLGGVRPSARARSSLVIVAKKAKKVQTAQPYGPGGGVAFKEGVDASGRVAKYGANVDGYSPIYTPEEWSPSSDVYVGGKTRLFLWAVTLAGILLGGALLVYSTSALAS